MSDLATMECTTLGDVVVASLAGEVDLSNAEMLRRTLAEAVPPDAVGLVLDFRGLVYLDSAGVRLLFHLSERLRERRQAMRLVVTDASPVHRVLDLVSLQETVPIDATVENAIGALEARTTDPR